MYVDFARLLLGNTTRSSPPFARYKGVTDEAGVLPLEYLHVGILITAVFVTAIQFIFS